MRTNLIAKVNNVDIVAISENSSSQLVPIRPICDALGIDYSRQLKKIKDDPDLGSVVGVTPTTGADGKTYEMSSLPLEFVFGWLFTINPQNVKPEAQEAVRQYRLTCYRALYEYFTEPQLFLQEKQKQIDAYLDVYNEKKRNFKNARAEMQTATKKLNEVRKITIDDWRSNNRQLDLPFTDTSEIEDDADE